jgi:hypothetical protein
MEIGTKPIPISVLTAVTNSALNAASVFPSRRIEISDSHSDLSRSADLRLASCATPRRCSAFNFSTSHCALHPRPHISRYGQAAACPRAATQTYRSLRFPTVAALVPSAGSITLQIELRSDAGAVSPRHPVRARALRGPRPTHRKAKTMEVPSILQGPWRLADWIDGIS